MGASIVHGIPLSEEPGIGALTIPGYLHEVTERFADREALVYRTAESVERWSYRELWARASDVARALIARGVSKDSRVGILMTNRPEFLAAAFGTALAGGVAVILNTFSTPVELDYLVQVSGISVLLFERTIAGKDFAQTLLALEPQIKTAEPGRLASTKFPFLRRLIVLDKAKTAPAPQGMEAYGAFLDAGESTPADLVEATSAGVKPSDTAVIFFSSGTTSTPKGVIHAQRAVALQWWRWPWVYSVGDDVRSWTANGFFWSGQFSLAIGVALSSGGAIVLQSIFNAEEAVTLWETERVTLPLGRPHQWARIEAAPNFAGADLSSLRYVDTRMSFGKHPTIKTDWRHPQSFGATETLTINTTYPAGTPYDVIDKSFGLVMGGNTLKIVDPLTNDIVPIGARGEIAIKGPTLMLGYLGKTIEECFDAEGFYRTGDGGYVDEIGRLFWEGRLTDIIKTGGANVSPLEVDLAIAKYPGVKVTQTVGLPDDMMGEVVVTCIVPHDGTSVEESGLRDFLKERLASYKIPRRVLFFREDEVSLTGSGAKIKAGEVRKLAADRLGVKIEA